MSIYENVKDLAKAINDISNLELKHRLIELLDENHDLKLEVKELTHKLALKASMTLGEDACITRKASKCPSDRVLDWQI